MKWSSSTLSKDNNQILEEYLKGNKWIAESLASIGSLALDMDLVTLTLNIVDEDYDILVFTLSCYTNLHTFDDLCANLID